MVDGPVSRVAYLVNQYPKTSHSFIRREIRGLEALGVTIDRYSVRSTDGGHVDPSDVEEAQRTTVLLNDVGHLVKSILRMVVTSPLRFTAAARQALKYAVRSDRNWVSHTAYLAEACVLKTEMARRGTRHLHAHFGTNSAIVATLCHTLGGPEFSFTVHGPEEFDRASVLRLGATIESSKFVAAISDFGRSQLCRLVERHSWAKIAVIRCGLDEGLLNREPPPIPEEPRLVCVGRLHEQKGQFVLLDALAELQRRGIACQVVLAGDGPLRADIEEEIRRLDLKERVCITGWLTEKQVIEELSSARALVLPSFGEGLPVVIMEAMALGRPVISTYIAGIPELVKPGENGWLVPAGAVGPLVDAMIEVLQAEPGTLAAMGKRGQKAVRLKHDIQITARKLQHLFQAEGTPS